jgi:hypothetical protein
MLRQDGSNYIPEDSLESGNGNLASSLRGAVILYFSRRITRNFVIPNQVQGNLLPVQIKI